MKAWLKVAVALFASIGSYAFAGPGVNKEATLRQALGPAAEALLQPKRVQVGELAIVSVAETRQYALKGTDRLAGYPIAKQLSALDGTTSQQLANMLLDEHNYVDVRQRCKNDTLRGIRFQNAHIVEVTIGGPCNHVVAAYREGKTVKWWGGVLSPAASEKVTAILRQR